MNIILQNNTNGTFNFLVTRQKRKRRKREKRQRQREEENLRRQKEEETRPPAHIEKDGVIHVETHHPRSSIIIIRSSHDDEPPKPKKESSFVLPDVYSRNTKKMSSLSKADENENDIDPELVENLNISYGERKDYEDFEEKLQDISDDENDSRETRKGFHGYSANSKTRFDVTGRKKSAVSEIDMRGDADNTRERSGRQRDTDYGKRCTHQIGVPCRC